MRAILLLLALFSMQVGAIETQGGAPMVRMRLGINALHFTVGDTYTKEPLGAMATFNPAVLWNFASFRARIGFHYMGDYGSPYGTTPISGIGVSALFYPFGLSTAYEISPDATLIQKSKPNPYAFAMLTPVNFNVNAGKNQSPSGSPITFSAYMIEMGLGAGYDYPIQTNMIMSAEIQYRFASAQEKTTAQAISYSGMGVMFVFSTSYH